MRHKHLPPTHRVLSGDGWHPVHADSAEAARSEFRKNGLPDDVGSIQVFIHGAWRWLREYL